MRTYVIPFSRRLQGAVYIQTGGKRLSTEEEWHKRKCAAWRKSNRVENDEAQRALAEKATAPMVLDEDAPIGSWNRRKP